MDQQKCFKKDGHILRYVRQIKTNCTIIIFQIQDFSRHVILKKSNKLYYIHCFAETIFQISYKNVTVSFTNNISTLFEALLT